MDVVATGRARLLTADDLSAAAALVGRSLVEMPLYRWILGDDAADPLVRDWLARAVLTPLLDGNAVGVDDPSGDGLLGLLAWSRDGSSRASATPAVDADFVRAHEQTARRLVHAWTSDLTPAPEPGAVNLTIAAVRPDGRRSGVLYHLVDPVHAHCVENDLRFYAWTGLPELRDAFRDGWNLTQFATVDHVDGSVLYGLQSARPPLPVAVGRINRSTARGPETRS